MKTKAERCAVCNGFKPPSGWKQHARFPDMKLCSRVCVDTAGAGGSATESAKDVSKVDPVLAAPRPLHATARSDRSKLPAVLGGPATEHPIIIPPAGQKVPALDEVRIPAPSAMMSESVAPGKNVKLGDFK